MEIAKAIVGELPIADEIAHQLFLDYNIVYREAGFPYGNNPEGFYQYISHTRVINGEELNDQ